MLEIIINHQEYYTTMLLFTINIHINKQNHQKYFQPKIINFLKRKKSKGEYKQATEISKDKVLNNINVTGAIDLLKQ